MTKQSLHNILTGLHNELKDIKSVDENERKLLKALMNDIQDVLNHSCEHQTLREQLTDAIYKLEKSHPTLVLTMKNVVETLSNMGI